MDKPKKEIRKMEKELQSELVRTNEEVIMPINVGNVVDRLFDRFESMSPEVRDPLRISIAGQDRSFKIFPDGVVEITSPKFQVVVEKRDGNFKDLK
ncbi:hypothetical protein FCL47_18740 [Desulfopila sp. IMCC35006]|uniref:hypothetical protein n=1 Tax=Desulfopila sp. IMCC35006 TaxID=2569542 RepID=UPI0010AD2CDB|nr:hypothetical protein [Desulfopila sp. IMCC35006]TKB24226.1 hypothetical protein FCL47_18740 [Desulfopila sp. IMCC35006]